MGADDPAREAKAVCLGGLACPAERVAGAALGVEHVRLERKLGRDFDDEDSDERAARCREGARRRDGEERLGIVAERNDNCPIDSSRTLSARLPESNSLAYKDHALTVGRSASGPPQGRLGRP